MDRADYRDRTIAKALEGAEFYGGNQGAKQDDHEDELLVVTASSVTPRNVRWLWRGWVPLGMVSLLLGLPGRGKTTLAEQLAADPRADGSRVI